MSRLAVSSVRARAVWDAGVGARPRSRNGWTRRLSRRSGDLGWFRRGRRRALVHDGLVRAGYQCRRPRSGVAPDRPCSRSRGNVSAWARSDRHAIGSRVDFLTASSTKRLQHVKACPRRGWCKGRTLCRGCTGTGKRGSRCFASLVVSSSHELCRRSSRSLPRGRSAKESRSDGR